MSRLADPFAPSRVRRWLAFLEDAGVGIPGKGNCQLWTGSAPDGYGRFYCPSFPNINGGTKRGNMVLAHRYGVVWLFGEGALHGLDGDHACRRTLCCNPLHVLGATRSENVIRGNLLRNRDLTTQDFHDADFVW